TLADGLRGPFAKSRAGQALRLFCFQAQAQAQAALNGSCRSRRCIEIGVAIDIKPVPIFPNEAAALAQSVAASRLAVARRENDFGTRIIQPTVAFHSQPQPA